MATDRNPNNVKRSEVDELFLAHVGEQTRRGSAKKDRTQIRQANLRKAEEIVEKANKKKKS